jgi:hypothetical protein
MGIGRANNNSNNNNNNNNNSNNNHHQHNSPFLSASDPSSLSAAKREIDHPMRWSFDPAREGGQSLCLDDSAVLDSSVNSLHSMSMLDPDLGVLGRHEQRQAAAAEAVASAATAQAAAAAGASAATAAGQDSPEQLPSPEMIGYLVRAEISRLFADGNLRNIITGVSKNVLAESEPESFKRTVGALVEEKLRELHMSSPQQGKASLSPDGNVEPGPEREVINRNATSFFATGASTNIFGLFKDARLSRHAPQDYDWLVPPDVRRTHVSSSSSSSSSNRSNNSSSRRVGGTESKERRPRDWSESRRTSSSQPDPATTGTPGSHRSNSPGSAGPGMGSASTAKRPRGSDRDSDAYFNYLRASRVPTYPGLFTYSTTVPRGTGLSPGSSRRSSASSPWISAVSGHFWTSYWGQKLTERRFNKQHSY